MEGKYLGLLFVLLFAISRYNRDPSYQYMTTSVYYYGGMTFYLCLTTTFYALLVYALQQPEFLKQILDIPELGIENENSPLPLTAALILTTLLPNIPKLNVVDNWALKVSHQLAGMPYGYKSLSNILLKSYFEVPGIEQTNIEKLLTEKNFQPEDFEDKTSPKVSKDFKKIFFLMHKLNEWRERSAKMKPFMDFYSSDFTIIQDEYKVLSERTRGYFRALHVDKKENPNSKTIMPDIAMVAFAAQCDALNQKICDLIAKGILFSSSDEIKQKETIRQFGFPNITNIGGTIPMNIISLSFMFILFGLLGSTLVSAITEPQATEKSIRFILIGVNISACIGITILIKANSPNDDIYQSSSRPYGAYLLTGILATLSVYFIKGLEFYLTEQSPKIANFIQEEKGWILFFFTLSYTLSYLCDNHAFKRSKPPAKLRFIEATTLGFIMAFIFAFSPVMQKEISQEIMLTETCYNCQVPDRGFETVNIDSLHEAVLMDFANNVIHANNENTNGSEKDKKTYDHWEKILGLLGTTFIIFFFIGFFVPHLYRKDRYQSPAERFVLRIMPSNSALVHEFASFNGDKTVPENAIISAAALVISSDGHVADEEIDSAMVLIYCLMNQKLMSQSRNYFRQELKKVSEDLLKGTEDEQLLKKERFLENVKKVKSQKTLSFLIGHLCIDIALADESFDANEEYVIHDIFDGLGLDQNFFKSEIEHHQKTNVLKNIFPKKQNKKEKSQTTKVA